ncbi:heme-binding protein [Mycetocola sp. JXN-3]|uniref:GlcG/HbpS family heme-binding protein n=1 Tax=Mycetocola sp. JXN-3 TaxID=2116510 RepID=UPI00165D2992|nr:heme-binding protein [Mycetocola sp. JXN-3]
MTITSVSPVILTRTRAHLAVDAGFARGTELGAAFTIAVLDGAGNLVAHVREDGAALASIGTSAAKALTAVHFAQPTAALQGAVAPGAALFGLGSAQATYAFVAGGVPIVDPHGVVIGAVGAGGGTPDQDREVAEAAAAALA